MSVTYANRRQSGDSAIYINRLAYADRMLTASTYVFGGKSKVIHIHQPLWRKDKPSFVEKLSTFLLANILTYTWDRIQAAKKRSDSLRNRYYPNNRYGLRKGNDFLFCNLSQGGGSLISGYFTRLYTATTYLMRSAWRGIKIGKLIFTFFQKAKNRLYIPTTYAMPHLLLLIHILRDNNNLFAGAREAEILKIPKARAA